MFPPFVERRSLKWLLLVSKKRGFVIMMVLAVWAFRNQHAVFSKQNMMTTCCILLSKSLLRMSGDGWQINSDPHAGGHKFECKWLDFQAHASGKTAKFCGHPFPDGLLSLTTLKTVSTFITAMSCLACGKIYNP